MRTLRTRSAAVAAAAFLLAAGAPGGTRADDRDTDFNGDGYDDVLVGAPDATVSGRHRAGAVIDDQGPVKALRGDIPGPQSAHKGPVVTGR
ncbi:FG-GAP repeat protein [Streptomyces sp. NPDC005017]|uniref:FG-GAP repeat protein n=1 Tax=Streptomyces sp. NPDC005017 TaxID=3364706 RepID=UPI0036C432CD